MQSWWAEETSFKNIKNSNVSKLLTCTVYIYMFEWLYCSVLLICSVSEFSLTSFRNRDMRNALRLCHQSTFTVLYLCDEKSLWETESSSEIPQDLQNERLQRWNNRIRSLSLSLSLSLSVYHALREQDPLKQPPLRSKSNLEWNLSSRLNTHRGERSSPGHQTSSAWISESRSPSHDHRNQTGSVRIRSVWETLKEQSNDTETPLKTLATRLSGLLKNSLYLLSFLL